MSTSVEAAVLCTICNPNGALRCAQCRSVSYCSKKCQRIDWPTHKLLCRSFSSDFRVPPGPMFKRGILFPVSEKTPKFIWVKITRVYAAEGDEYDRANLTGLMGPGEPVQGYLHCRVNAFRNRKLENTSEYTILQIAHRDSFLKDGSLPNQSISKGTRGEHAHRWAGPIVALKLKGLDGSFYGDMNLEDFRHTVDFFVTYWNETFTNDILTGLRNVTGVRISCNGDQATLGAEKYIPVDVEDCHEVFRMHEPIGISKLIELPIFVRKCPPHQAWKNDSEANYTNLEASWLHLDLDPKSKKFGWIPLFEWDERVGSVLAVRVDRKVLSPHHMEALCHFCQFTLQPLIEDSLIEDRVKRTRNDVMREITKAKFKEFFREYKAMNPSWTATPCPYEI